jgi:hypothetical protein
LASVWPYPVTADVAPQRWRGGVMRCLISLHNERDLAGSDHVSGEVRTPEASVVF